MNREIFLEYRESGVLTNAFNVTLASEDGSYGIRRITDGVSVVSAGTATSQSSTGTYTYSGDFSADTIYEVAWRVVVRFGDDPRYFVDQIGPFPQTNDIRAVVEQRGTFIQAESSVLYLRVSDMDGNAVDPSAISYIIKDPTGNVVISASPEKAGPGFYVIDWFVDYVAPLGTYQIIWLYTVDGEEKQELQAVVVAARVDPTAQMGLYYQRINEFRMALTYMLDAAQHIPVYREPTKQTKDRKTYEWTFPRWNQSAGVRIYRNDQIVTGGITVDYFHGKVIFDVPLTKYDRVEASYSFRWFSDEELDTFLSNATGLYNIWPPVTSYGMMNVGQDAAPVILYGAAVDALRHMLLALQFQEAQLVFGGPEASQKAYQNLESLKKNYEDTWNKALEQKKNGSYVGLTRMAVTPEFALPGGRSRWFRYMFSSGT